MFMTPTKFDHWVSSVESLDSNCTWYFDPSFAAIDEYQLSLKGAAFAQGKINGHPVENLLSRGAMDAIPGVGDCWFLLELVGEWLRYLQARGIPITESGS